MKRLLFASLIIALSFSLKSQDFGNSPSAQGGVYLNAGTSANLIRIDEEVTQLNMQVGIGWFIVDNISLGGRLDWTYTDLSGGVSNSVIVGGPVARYYIGGRYFVGGGLLVQKSDGIDPLFSIEAQVGYPIFLSDIAAFEPTFSYSYGLDDELGNSFTVNFGFSFYFEGGGKDY